MTPSTQTVTIIPGDGVGPEVVQSALDIMTAAKVPLAWDVQQAGACVFKQGLQTGVPQDTIESINRTRVVLKGPLETPVGFGEKSANVTLRKLFETYGNIRPIRELPNVHTPYSGRHIDLVVVRENVEDLYAGIEHMQTPSVAQCLKLISKKGCEKIVRLAFEFAKSQGRKKIHCATKSNIMKLTEGLLKKTFESIAPEYPDIEAYHIIVDNCAHQLVKNPEQFDIIVTTNMNGDILSDLTSALVGGLGFAPSANLGSDIAIFEAVHGSAPKYAGKNVINPTALILSAVMMLRHLHFFDLAQTIEQAVMVTLEDGILTRDVVGDAKSISTTAFTQAIIDRLGQQSRAYAPRHYEPLIMPQVTSAPVVPEKRHVVGVDVFVEAATTPASLGKAVETVLANTPLKLKMISNRGTQVYPLTGTQTDCTDQWRCRLVSRTEDPVSNETILDVITRISSVANWAHIEKLQEFDGVRAYTKAQGEM